MTGALSVISNLFHPGLPPPELFKNFQEIISIIKVLLPKIASQITHGKIKFEYCSGLYNQVCAEKLDSTIHVFIRNPTMIATCMILGVAFLLNYLSFIFLCRCCTFFLSVQLKLGARGARAPTQCSQLPLIQRL